MSKIECGVQLYTTRELSKTREDIVTLFENLRSYGVPIAQLSGINEPDVKFLRQVADDYGIRLLSTHSPMDRVVNDTDRLAEEHLILGADTIGIGSYSHEYSKGKQGIDKFCDLANTVTDKLKQYGLKFALHNHNMEFKKCGIIDRDVKLFKILENTTDLEFILDVYWIKVAGFDPCEVIDKMSGRITHLHLKDYGKNDKGKVCIKDLGEGEFDFAKILKQSEVSGVKYAYIEHDDTLDPLRTVENGMEYLRRIY